ncbi:hypothetical protein Psuf_025780 [Phytohabitans suffuscus]|uniref:Uncharacterized protein n=1 Tax=Phytohabitans suffuscus TaxID=624315 RepID=A0A6F8YGM1_9ACTN|nr:hypothetical protein Psuf_025780 [Phytohabitans suffuscus]
MDGIGLGQPRPRTVTLRNIVLVAMGSRSVTKALVDALGKLRNPVCVTLKRSQVSHTSYNA